MIVGMYGIIGGVSVIIIIIIIFVIYIYKKREKSKDAWESAVTVSIKHHTNKKQNEIERIYSNEPNSIMSVNSNTGDNQTGEQKNDIYISPSANHGMCVCVCVCV